jgi:beta-N-acetylhexosaminidase
LRIPVRIDLALIAVRIALILAILPFAIGWRTPLFAGWRYTALAILIALPLLLIALEIRALRRNRLRSRAVKVVSGVALALALLTLGATTFIELQFQYQRRAVLSADAQALERLGRHLLVGYRDKSTLQALIDRRAIAGVFLSARNVEGKSIETIRQQTATLQGTRLRQNLIPLWIATDQEGGSVSRLSPPLTRMAPIADIVALHPDRAELLIAIRQYAAHQGRELSGLGVNLNFAPVVDLNHGVVNPDDRLSRISSRAISADPTVVTEVAEVYCHTLKLTGVRCTLKHFPGLGRVYEDTHKVTAKLASSAAELEASDWLPFRQLMADEATFTMLSHARLNAVDPDRPASFSDAVVNGLLRQLWKHEGVLLTDDFSMGAVTLSREGAAGGAIAALNAGVDLILVSYDPDQYFPIMYALLAADRAGRLRGEMLERSDERLRRAALPANQAASRANDVAEEVRHNP